MKKTLCCFAVLILAINLVKSQTLTGRLVDQNGVGLSGIRVYTLQRLQDWHPRWGTEWHSLLRTNVTNSEGYFTFGYFSIVGVEKNKNEIPESYAVYNNYPNPFNPKTRIGFTMPVSGNVKLKVYNNLGQNVGREINKYYNAGNNYIDIDLHGLPNGVYFANVVLNEKFSFTKKMMLLYGSQHLQGFKASPSYNSYKENPEPLKNDAIKIDSLVAIGPEIGKQTFFNLPAELIDNKLNVGDLIVDFTKLNLEVPTLRSPINGAINQIVSPFLCWNTSIGARKYNLQVAEDSNFTKLIYHFTEFESLNQQFNLLGLKNSTKYYWRVSASNGTKSSQFSEVRNFTTRSVSFNENRAPEFPKLTSSIKYIYWTQMISIDSTFKAIDPDGEKITYSLAQPAPKNSFVNSETGRLTWEDYNLQWAVYVLTLIATDSNGAKAEHVCKISIFGSIADRFIPNGKNNFDTLINQ